MLTDLNMKLLAPAAMVGASVFAAHTADAAMMIKLESGIDTVTASDEVITEDLAIGAPGTLLVKDSVGVFGTVIATGLDATSLTATDGILHLNVVAVNTLGPGDLTVSLTMTGLTGPIGDVPATFGIGGLSGGSVEFTAWVDTSNAAFGEGEMIASYTILGAGSFADFTVPAESITVDDEYSATIVAVITHDGIGATSFDAETSVVPEPGSLALIGLGGLLIARRRRG